MEPTLTIDSFGTKEWYLNGQLHRENGPAVEYPDSSTEWWLNGKELIKQQLTSKKMKIDYPELYNSYLVYQIMEN